MIFRFSNLGKTELAPRDEPNVELKCQSERRYMMFLAIIFWFYHWNLNCFNNLTVRSTQDKLVSVQAKSTLSLCQIVRTYFPASFWNLSLSKLHLWHVQAANLIQMVNHSLLLLKSLILELAKELAFFRTMKNMSYVRLYKRCRNYNRCNFEIRQPNCWLHWLAKWSIVSSRGRSLFFPCEN